MSGNEEKKSWYVYCLSTYEPPYNTYIGATVDPDRRLGQHNGGRSKGGAKATSVRPNEWHRICYVKGFVDNHAALAFEWRWKYFTRCLRASGAGTGNPLERRQAALDKTMVWAVQERAMNNLEIIFE
jgi:predicted GIY-YIG superfamily endonuclease